MFNNDTLKSYHEELDNLISKINDSDFKLTKEDVQIYNAIDSEFKDLVEEELATIKLEYDKYDMRKDFVIKAVVLLFQHLKIYMQAYDSGSDFGETI